MSSSSCSTCRRALSTSMRSCSSKYSNTWRDGAERKEGCSKSRLGFKAAGPSPHTCDNGTAQVHAATGEAWVVKHSGRSVGLPAADAINTLPCLRRPCGLPCLRPRRASCSRHTPSFQPAPPRQPTHLVIHALHRVGRRPKEVCAAGAAAGRQAGRRVRSPLTLPATRTQQLYRQRADGGARGRCLPPLPQPPRHTTGRPSPPPPSPGVSSTDPSRFSAACSMNTWPISCATALSLMCTCRLRMMMVCD